MSVHPKPIFGTPVGEGPLLVLIHGAFVDSRYWAPNVEELSRDFRVLPVNLPGAYPDRDSNADHTGAEQVAFLTALFHQQPDGAHVLGHSRGGRLALHLAALAPEKVRSLILAEPGGQMEPDFSKLIERPGDSDPGWAKEARAGALALLEKGELEDAARFYIDTSQGDGQWAAAPPLFRQIAPDNIATLRWISKDDTVRFSTRLAKQVRARTLLLVGTESPQIFGRIATALLSCIPNVTQAHIEGAGHFLNLTHRERFDQLARDFLLEVEQARSSGLVG